MMIEQGKRALVLGLVIVALIGMGGARRIDAAVKEEPAQTPPPTLIILFDPRLDVPSVESILSTVNTADGREKNRQLYDRLGQPLLAQRLYLRPPTSWEIELARKDPVATEALPQFYVVLVYPPKTDLDVLQKQLQEDPQMLAVAQNFTLGFSVFPATEPDDLYFPRPPTSKPPGQIQWGMGSPAVSLGSLNFPAAWAKILGHAYVGVLDSGIQAGTSASPNVHPDLKQNFKRHFSNNASNPLWYSEVDEKIGSSVESVGEWGLG